MTGVREFDAAYHLDNPEVIAAYLAEAFETHEAAFIAHAIRTVARARGMEALAEKVGMSRSGLYKALNPEKGNPSFATILEVLSSLGMGVSVRPQRLISAELHSGAGKVLSRAVASRPAAKAKRARKK